MIYVLNNLLKFQYLNVLLFVQLKVLLMKMIEHNELIILLMQLNLNMYIHLNKEYYLNDHNHFLENILLMDKVLNNYLY